MLLQRSVTHTFTTLDVLRRKWANLGSNGKAALTNLINSRLRLAHAENRLVWPPGLAAVQKGVGLHARQQRQSACASAADAMQGLEKIVADMKAAVATLRTKVAASGLDAKAAAILHGQTAERLSAS